VRSHFVVVKSSGDRGAVKPIERSARHRRAPPERCVPGVIKIRIHVLALRYRKDTVVIGDEELHVTLSLHR